MRGLGDSWRLRRIEEGQEDLGDSRRLRGDQGTPGTQGA